MNKYIRKYGLIGLILISGDALAQPSPEPRAYTLTVTAQDIGLIGGALGKQPYSEVAGLLAKLDAQIKEQDKPKPMPDAVGAPGDVGGKK